MSKLRHWRARTTSATSSSTSATRRVAVAEELLRDLSKLGPLRPLASSSCSTQSLFHLRDASAVGRGMSPRLPVRPLPWLGPVEASQAHCPADPCFAQMCREHFRSAHSCALWTLPCLRLAQQIACAPSWPPLLPALSCACARRAMVLVSGDGRAQALTLAAAVLCACILVPARFTCS